MAWQRSAIPQKTEGARTSERAPMRPEIATPCGVLCSVFVVFWSGFDAVFTVEMTESYRLGNNRRCASNASAASASVLQNKKPLGAHNAALLSGPDIRDLETLLDVVTSVAITHRVVIGQGSGVLG